MKYLLLLLAVVLLSYKLLLYEIVVPLALKENPPPQPPLPVELQSFLERPLSFIGMGSQCLVFSDAASPYVLKICKANRYQNPRILQLPFLSRILSAYLSKKQLTKTRRMESDFFSYEQSWKLLSSQTGILYCHLHPSTHPSIHLCLKDPLGIPHKFMAQDLCFYIQKKAIPLSLYLADLARKNQRPAIQTLFQKLLAMETFSKEQGLFLKDLHPAKNIGMIGEEPIWIDPGRISSSPNSHSIYQSAFLDFLFALDPDLPQLWEEEKKLLNNP